MYVAATRAEKRLFLTESEGYSVQGGFNKLPSRFIREIREDLFVTEGHMDEDLWNRAAVFSKSMDAECGLVVFEKKGLVGKGKFGVSPRAAYHFFKKAGYRVTMSGSNDTAVINEIGAQSDTVIVTVYNDKNNIMKQIHTVNVSKDAVGKFYVHNGYKVRTDAGGNLEYVSAGPYDTLDAAVKGMAQGNAGVLSVIGIFGEGKD